MASREKTTGERKPEVGPKPKPASTSKPAPSAKPTRTPAPSAASTSKPTRARKPTPKPPGKAVAEAASAAAGQYLAEQRAAIEAATALEGATAEASARAAATRKRGGSDPLTAELRGQLLPLLVLHFMHEGPTYGNQLIDRVTELTGGVLTVNPNTMYPLLRTFEAKGLIEGQWEHPERRSRRFYSLTAAGEKELARLRPAARKSLEALGRTLADIKGELFG